MSLRKYLENFESRNVENPDEAGLFHRGVHQRLVALFHQVLEDPVVQAPGYPRHRLVGLVDVLPLGDPLGAHLDLGLAEGLHHEDWVDAEELGRLGRLLRAVWLALLLAALLLEFLHREGRVTFLCDSRDVASFGDLLPRPRDDMSGLIWT